MNAGAARAAILKFNPPAGSPFATAPAPTAPAAPAPDAGKVTMPSGRWARYAGKLGAALTVTVSAASIRRGGREPNEPDDSDVDLLQEALEEGLRLKFGDTGVPWWLGAALAAGGVYAGMRIGAVVKIAGGPADKLPAALTPEAPAAPAPTSPLKPTMPASIFPPVVRGIGQ